MDEKGQWINKREPCKDQQKLMLLLKDVEEKLADLKARWPFHSVQPRMVSEREDLEEERERLMRLLDEQQ
ncbi:hypothetical protein [Desulfosporosinus shakirovi]|uniref:hypothetical protein n=1 Tax=Desulfosporosinus shakirovi TaxID=2885154 RepID=UPI001E5D7100|nr:hypothetical protein [Desulfosporosinus sp. SRJS8]MCB8817498.1 hypothetical protein [Desulfosporosinus sp. SRJS8]